MTILNIAYITGYCQEEKNEPLSFKEKVRSFGGGGRSCSFSGDAPRGIYQLPILPDKGSLFPAFVWQNAHSRSRLPPSTPPTNALSSKKEKTAILAVLSFLP